LDDTGINEVGWVALRLISAMPPPIAKATLTAQLCESKKIDHGGALAVLRDLEGRGILQIADTISMTPEGAALYEQLSSKVGELIAYMWEGLDAADLAIAAQMLTTITERANALLSS
jgi:hypothetical protein